MAAYTRILVAVAVACGCLVLLDPVAPELDPNRANYESYAFWLKVKGALRYFFAMAVGAVVARRSIAVPATVIAVGLWVWTIHVLYKIALPAGPVDLGQLLLSNLDVLAMTVTGGILGSMLGSWFYRREIASKQAAA